MKCPSCGQENTSNSRFCGSCRFTLPNPDQEDPSTVFIRWANQEYDKRGPLRLVLSLMVWFWAAMLVITGLAMNQELGGSSGQMLSWVAGVLCFLSGLIIFRKNLLFGLPRYKTAIALFVFSFIFFIMSVPSDTAV